MSNRESFYDSIPIDNGRRSLPQLSNQHLSQMTKLGHSRLLVGSQSLEQMSNQDPVMHRINK